MRYTEQQISCAVLDQPEFVGEPKKLFICSSPRSGSYMLCRVMINAGVGVPHEYFNPIIIRQIAPRFGLGESAARLKWRRRSPWDYLPFGRAARSSEEAFLQKYVAALVPRRCQGGVFAAKIHFDQFQKVLDNPVGWKLFESGIFVHLYREDLLRQAVSMHFAQTTGRWGIDDVVTTVPAANPNFFDTAAIHRILETLAEADRGWRAFLAQNALSPIWISYEQLCHDPFAIVVMIARRLGLDPATLRRGYSEEEALRESDPAIPSKHDVVRHYLAARRTVHGAMPPQHSHDRAAVTVRLVTE